MIDGARRTGQPIRWAMVGGGRGSQIGYVHRSAALRDRAFELVAGTFDLDPGRGREFGVELGVDPGRCYPDHATMFAAEQRRSDGIQAVSIATPNNTHYAICKAALEHGLHVVCEKPLCFTVAEAEELRRLAAGRNRVVGVAYGYAGHQMIEQARAMVAMATSARSAWSICNSPTAFTARPSNSRIRRPAGGSIRASPARATCSAIWAPIRFTCPR